jgi:hypothetical protein
MGSVAALIGITAALIIASTMSASITLRKTRLPVKRLMFILLFLFHSKLNSRNLLQILAFNGLSMKMVCLGCAASRLLRTEIFK